MASDYLIATGWWCAGDDESDERKYLLGSSEIRGRAFHKLWYESVRRCTKGQPILIVDSNSPVLPDLYSDETMIRLRENFGHAANCKGDYSGYTAAIFASLGVAYANGYDYWVYVEQDALLYGDDIIEYCIANMQKDYMFGAPPDRRSPCQQSLMIMRKRGIPKFIRNYTKISATDQQIAPEVKFEITTSPILSRLPEWLFTWTPNRRLMVLKHLLVKAITLPFRPFVKGYQNLPVGVGRQRPIDFSSKRFYFQHGSAEEIERYLDLVKSP